MNEQKDRIEAFKMKLDDGKLAEYKRRHNPIWPELTELLSSVGIYDYHIFHDAETNYLFAFLRCPQDADLSVLELEPIMQKWWESMAQLMETQANNKPVSVTLERVFTL